MKTPLVQHKMANVIGEFTWIYGAKFFIETDIGNYVWSDPDYNGDNSLTKFQGSYKDWLKQEMIPYGRLKGRHKISEYCGNDVTVVE